MARSRIIKPGFFKNEVLAEIEPFGRLLFAGLWTLADRDGRVEDRPKRIKAELFPWDDVDVDRMLSELAARDFILRYEVPPISVIQITKFAEHQTPHVRETGGKLPSPEKAVPSTRQAQKRSPVSVSVSVPVSVPVHEDDAAREIAGEQFAIFWDAYPRHIGKAAAERAFHRLKPSGAVFEAMLIAISHHKRSPQWTKDGGQFIPHAATWINQRRWEDEIATPQTGSYQPREHAAYDRWPEECRSLHAGECGNYQAHQIRLMRDAERRTA